jgi:hypothetical protein
MDTIGVRAFSGCTGLTSVTIGSGVRYIRASAFQNCTGLTSVTIPDNVVGLASPSGGTEGVFQGCTGLTSVIIGKNVTIIGSDAFRGCNGITSVTSLNPVPPSLSSAFESETIANISLYVPKESIEDYGKANRWKDFASINDVADAPGVSVLPRAYVSRASSSLPQISVRGKTLTVRNFGVSSMPVNLRLIDLRGKTVSSFSAANMNAGSFSLSKVPAGRYFVEVRQSGVRLGTAAVLVR